ncbi:hypothetical protein HK101_010857 [Irineochytrium annulatum]|nr:hypothetical protein HK101_010857 [Irineochytrium annulatum]
MPAIIAHLANAVRGAIIHPTMQRLVMMAPAGVGTIVRSGCWQVPSPNANAVKRTFSSTPVALGARWTAENDEFLRNNMNMPLEELQSHFPNRTVTAIKARQRLIKSQMSQANDPVDGSLSQTKGDAQDVINPNNFCPREDQDNSEAEAQNPSPRPTMNDRAENTVGDAASAGVGEGREGIESMGDHKGAK